jgi:hypothetical protein
MTLKPEDHIPGLWRSDPPIAAGAHALVIGVSDYPFLGGGSAPDGDRAPDNGGLVQLEVSALSGALFFDWLKAAGEIAGAPLASCRLLLAPRPDERDPVDRLTEGHYSAADYEPMRSALIDWGNDIAAGGRTKEPNVAVFFFSGHGVEVAASPAILARDVLNQRTADRGANKAVAVDSMSTAVKTYDIDRGLFFVDACRDSPRVARLLNLVGDQPLKPSAFPQRRVDALIRLQSTASGLKSYQAKQDPGTIFTQALLDGLNGPPPSYLPYDTTSIPWQLLFNALEGHVKRKVIDLLADRSPLALQTVEPYGNPYNALMLVARKDAPIAPIAPVDVRDAADLVQEAVEDSAARILRTASSLTVAEIDSARHAGWLKWTRSGLRPDFFMRIGDLGNPGIMQRIFEHESIANPWIYSLSFVDAQTGEGVAADTVRIVGAYSKEIDTRVAAWIDMAVAPNPGGVVWIRAGGPHAGMASSAVAIPQDRYYPIPARLDVLFDRSDGPWVLSSMGARLCDPAKLRNADAARVWRPLWEAQRTEALADLASAGRIVEEGLAEILKPVDGKSESPIAAALAVNYLLRSGAREPFLGWSGNLENWFDWLPDGPVLWAEALWRRHEGEFAVADMIAGMKDEHGRGLQLLQLYPAVLEALNYFLMLSDRGAPLLARSLAIALRHAALWHKVQDAGLVGGGAEHSLARALDNVERAGRYAVSGGGFARFVSPDSALRAELVVGASRLRQAAPVAVS